MTLWFDDVTMQASVRQRRRRGLDLDLATTAAVLRRATHLDGGDETLVRLAIEGNHSYRALARMCRATPGATYRRVQRLLRRLTDPAAAALVEASAGLSALQREIGIRHFVRRQPVSEIARELGMNRREIHRVSAYVRGWMKATQRSRTGAEEREATERRVVASETRVLRHSEHRGHREISDSKSRI